MRLLDLFCGAGIGADGYKLAGFDVFGIDNRAQPNYCGMFAQHDALEVLASDVPEDFDAIHASPPCQAHTRAQHLRDAQKKTASYGDCLTPTLALLLEKWAHKVWVVENVAGAPGMDFAQVLCGSMFGLGVRRHRLFLTHGFYMQERDCRHEAQGRPYGVYWAPRNNIPGGGRTALDLPHAKSLMGLAPEREVSWSELREAIPPAYTQEVGRAMRAAIASGVNA